MYICLCKAVTENKIRHAVAGGVCTLRELQYAHGVGTGCGKCVPAAKACLDEALRAQAPQHTLQTLSAGTAA